MKRFCALLVLAGALACGSTEPKATVTGSWSAAVSGSGTYAMTLTESNGTVSGNGTEPAGTSTIADKISGTFVNPTVSLTFDASGYEPSNFTGTLNGNTLAGTLNGSGYSNFAITYTRH